MPKLVIGVPVYEGVDQIDVAGAWDVLSRITKFHPKLTAELLLIGETGKPVTSGQGLIFTPAYSFKTCPKLDVLLVPGTQTLDNIVPDTKYIEFLKKRGKNARYVVSVCTGAVLLAEAGLLDGHRATTHWAALDRLRGYAKVTVANGYPRWVDCGNRMTTGGVRERAPHPASPPSPHRGEAAMGRRLPWEWISRAGFLDSLLPS